MLDAWGDHPAVREAVRMQLATQLQDKWQLAFDGNQTAGAYSPDAASSGKRGLANMALTYLCLADKAMASKAYQRFNDASNMTDRLGALVALVGAKHELAAEALGRFHALFATDDLVIDKWFALQAGQSDVGGDVLPLLSQLMSDINNGAGAFTKAMRETSLGLAVR